MKLINDLYWVASGKDGLFMTDALDCNVYLVKGQDGYILVDAGLGRDPESILKIIKEDHINPEDIRYVLLTHGHSDHAGGAAYFRNLGLQVIAPFAEADFIQKGNERMIGLDAARAAGYYPREYSFSACEVDMEVSIGMSFDILGISFQAYSAAGHSIGGLCYLCRIGDKQVLFSGDLILHGGKISLQRIPGADVHEYAKSVEALKDVDVDVFLPGHGLPSLQQGKEHILLAHAAFQKLIIPTG